MKFRRRFAKGGWLSEQLERLGAWWTSRRLDEPVVPGTPAAAERGAAAPAAERWAPPPAPGPDDATEPRMPSRIDRWVALWPFDLRRTAVLAGVLAGTFVFGYGLAATVLFPAPIIATNRSVPRVLGQAEEQAREVLRAAGFGIGTVDRTPHATVPPGSVVWQDPPPNTNAPEATEIALTLSTGARRVPVPDVAGYDADHARMLIEGAGLRIGSTESTQAPIPRNVAVNTRPPAGTALPPGSSVALVVSVGAATIRVPNLTGLTPPEARLALETAGLSLGTAFAQTTNAAAPGEVFYQEPSAGTLSAPGTAVNVRIARSR